METRTVYWLFDYSDEIVPCDCSLEGWAEWLSKPDEEWNRPEAANDGDAFKATKGTITYHAASASADECGWTFDPPLPDSYDSLVVAYGVGKGWDADDMVENLGDLIDSLKFHGDSVVAAIQDDGATWVVKYHANPPRCEAALAQ